MRVEHWIGRACIALAIGFNLPYLVLALKFDYPEILRAPAAEILYHFHAGGDGLVLTWWAFGLCALAQVGLSVGLLAGQARPRASAQAAAILGSLAGLVQAIGLWRWTFVVPLLARDWAEAGHFRRGVIEGQFELLHQFAGVAIGEHLGQWLTAAWVLCLTAAELRECPESRLTRLLAIASALGIGAGALEGLSTVLAFEPGLLAYGAPLGYGLFSAWLIAIGVHRMRAPAAGRLLRKELPSIPVSALPAGL